MSDEKEQIDGDGLEALASGLAANEEDEADEELDLAKLAAVAGSRTTLAGEQEAPADGADKLVLAGAEPSESVAPARSAPASDPRSSPGLPHAAAGSGRGLLVPALVVLALGLGAGGYLLGRSSSRATPASAASESPRAAAAPPTSSPPSSAELAHASPAQAVEAPAPPAPAAPAVDSPAQVEAPRPSARAEEVGARPRLGRAAEGAAKAPSERPAESEASPSPAEPPAAVPPADKPGAAPAALAKSGPGPDRSVDQLLDEALASPSERRAREAATPATLPEAPSREEVTQAMAVLLPAIRGCAMGQTGLATAGILVRSDGRVASVELTGAPFEGTASGRCMEGVLRRARFARFRQPTFRVRFPFAIQ